jgi:tetratricopeptide (TPR) repeat protein
MSVGPNSDAPLVEREDEERFLDAALERATDHRGGVVLIEGEAGVGKTRLLRRTAELAERRGLRVLRARGTELDRTFGFGLVRGLLERTVAELPELLVEGTEPAAVLLGSATPPAPEDADAFSRLHALYWLVAELAARGPLAIIADDLHWADTASLRWLVFMAERVEELPVLLVCATRPEEPGADQALLDSLAAAAETVVRPAPLSPAGASALVQARMPGAAQPFMAACHAATGGNPFLLGELVTEATAERVAGTAADADQVLAFGSERVGRAVRRRLQALDEPAGEVARAVAVLGPPVSLADVLGLTGLPRAQAGAAAEALASIGILTADRKLDFVHPVVRGAVYDQIPSLQRQALHGQAAALMTSRGAESERVARHLLPIPGTGDTDRLAVLRAAARDADARGAAEAAITYLRRALQEPPPRDEVAAVLHELGLAEAAARRREDFETHLRQARELARTPALRTRIGFDLGRALASYGEFRGSVQLFHTALVDDASTDDADAIALEAELLTIAFHEFTSTELVAPFWERRFAELDRGGDVAPELLAPLAVYVSASRGPGAEAIALAERALASGGLEAPNSVLVGAIGNSLIYAGALARADQVYGESITRAARRGNRLAVAWQSTMVSQARLRLGDVRAAEADARLALELFEDGSGAPGLAWCAAHLLDALVTRGGMAEAGELAGRFATTSWAAPKLSDALLHTSVAHFRLARGEPLAALESASAAGELVSGRISNPYCCDWRTAQALALVALGRRDEAVAVAEEQLDAARRFDISAATGAALRTLGMAIGGDAGVELLGEAVSVLEGTEARLDHARALLALGAALRRRDARDRAREVSARRWT